MRFIVEVVCRNGIFTSFYFRKERKVMIPFLNFTLQKEGKKKNSICIIDYGKPSYKGSTLIN